jgi:hypothetical protein
MGGILNLCLLYDGPDSCPAASALRHGRFSRKIIGDGFLSGRGGESSVCLAIRNATRGPRVCASDRA